MDLLAEYPMLEFGILYSAFPDGRNRYPEWGRIGELAEAFTGRCALHVCGRAAREMIFAMGVNLSFSRIQINGDVSEPSLRSIFDRGIGGGRPIITQWTPTKNTALVDVQNDRHQILVDASGGRGIKAETFVWPPTLKQIGHAGGIGLDNVSEVVKCLELTGRQYWIDMESSVRNDQDRFDLGICRQILEKIPV